ncbi:shikimate dehydrogenase [Uliginosibacterium sp. H1]|uniref:shikimate dehydrogenase n=1 Tax=Uliginosibacterium sp. H1 TaxID=3114757 RepID=UPI002E178A3C|nr:shikimate dehydrogenase [Uliginosibacterium sp. H1]
MTDRYAVIGNPIAQSKSPVLHSAFAQQTQQDLRYEALLAPVDGFVEAVRAFVADGGRGMNVTMPFKDDAFRFATRLSERAQRAQAVNTLAFRGEEIYGDTTDGVGLVRDIVHNLKRPLAGRKVLLLGAGGAVRGVIEPILAQQPALLFIANRTADKAAALADAFADLRGDTRLEGGGFEAIAGRFDVIVNGSAASMTGELPPVPAGAWDADSLVYDMAYKPQPTVFMQHAAATGAGTTADGIGMLVEQGAESFSLWREVRPDTAPVLAQLRAERGW